MRRFLGQRARFRDAAKNLWPLNSNGRALAIAPEVLTRKLLRQRTRFQPINNSRFFPIARLLQVK